jgi:hypothetical protein
MKLDFALNWKNCQIYIIEKIEVVISWYATCSTDMTLRLSNNFLMLKFAKR